MFMKWISLHPVNELITIISILIGVIADCYAVAITLMLSFLFIYFFANLQLKIFHFIDMHAIWCCLLRFHA